MCPRLRRAVSAGPSQIPERCASTRSSCCIMLAGCLQLWEGVTVVSGPGKRRGDYSERSASAHALCADRSEVGWKIPAATSRYSRESSFLEKYEDPPASRTA